MKKYIVIGVYALTFLEARAQTAIKAAKEGNAVVLSWDTRPGITYRLLSSQNLIPASQWKSVTNTPGTGTNCSMKIIPRNAGTYYTVEERLNPLFGMEFYVDPQSRAAREADALRTSSPANAALMDKIANEPQAFWFTGKESDVEKDVRAIVAAAAREKKTPVLAAYNIPLRDCGSFSGGGAVSSDAYAAWSQKLARGIGTNAAVVIVEPDALAIMDCLTLLQQTERLSLIRQMIDTLRRESAALVYVDGGHPQWQSAQTMASRLAKAGITNAHGFALNVSNFYYDKDCAAYGESISKLLGDMHFIIDSSRNGLGPNTAIANAWCNPPGRALGRRPIASTAHPLIDAYLWIKTRGVRRQLPSGRARCRRLVARVRARPRGARSLLTEPII